VNAAPPRAWRALLARLVDRESREFLIGDLDEEFGERAAAGDARRARAWYRRQARQAIVALPPRWRPRPVSWRRRGADAMSHLLQDLKYAWRMAVKEPTFSLVVILTLALAIGANTVIFSFANVFLLRPLPLRDPDRLGWIATVDTVRQNDRARSSLPDFLDWRASTRTFEALAARAPGSFTMTGRGPATRVLAARVTDNLIDVWGLRVIHGRGFHPGEEAPGAEPVVVLSHQFWTREFGADASVVGRSITLDSAPHTIVGVLAPEVELGNLALIDVWTPHRMNPATARRDERVFSANGRLRPGVTLEQASAEIEAIARRLQREHPDTNANWSARVASTKEALAAPDSWLMLTLLLVVVGFVLLIACANLANLVLARTTERRRELAVRTAIGASRWSLVRQLLIENALLSLAGGALGLALAAGGLRLIRAAAYEPFFHQVTIDPNVLAFTAIVSILTPILISALPALHSSASALTDALKDASRGSGGVRLRRSRSALVVAEVSLAVVLLIVGTLTIRTMIALTQVDLGIRSAGLLTARAQLAPSTYPGEGERRRFFERALAELRRLPGVEAAAIADRLPIVDGESVQPFSIQGRPDPEPSQRPWVARSVVSDGYFAALGIRVARGRALEARDGETSRPVVVISEEAARRYWGSAEQALGSRIRLGEEAAQWREVVGVAQNTKRGLFTTVSHPQAYVPLAQAPGASVAIFVRAGAPESLAGAARSAVGTIDPELALYEVRTLDESIRDELSSPRIIYSLFVTFALLALALAAAGLYGVVSYAVSQRTQEIGIRMALGARPAEIARMVLAQGIRMIAVGSAIGIAGGLVVARLISSVLFGVEAAAVSTYVAVVVVLGAVALLASYVPARRAMRVDPMRALRMD
jgi:putative ABC transport system permease protein